MTDTGSSNDSRILRNIDVTLVRRLLAAQFPPWAGLPLEPYDSAGTVNAVFRQGEDMAVRLPRLTEAVEDVAKEHHWLPRLAPQLPFPIPAVLGAGVPGAGYPWPWSVCRWLEGDVPEAGQLTAPDRLAEDLARFVAALWRIAPDGGPAAYRGGPLHAVDGETRAAIEELANAGDVDARAATAAWEEALAAPAWPGPPRWLHSDLMPGNVLVRDGR
jgi:aminoglycoside phosphotransferase (APT) family kinase protein